jgi:hypothetical protein
MVGRLRSARGTREPRCTTRGLRCGLDVPVDRLGGRGRRLSVGIAVIDAMLTNPWLAPALAEVGTPIASRGFRETAVLGDSSVGVSAARNGCYLCAEAVRRAAATEGHEGRSWHRGKE